MINLVLSRIELSSNFIIDLVHQAKVFSPRNKGGKDLL